jgi:hypothetical protein
MSQTNVPYYFCAVDLSKVNNQKALQVEGIETAFFLQTYRRVPDTSPFGLEKPFLW